MAKRTLTAPRVAAAVLVAATLMFSLGGLRTAPSVAALPLRDKAIPPSYFGMHIHDAIATPWPSVSIGAWRLWDSQTAWPQLEPERGAWHFERLDALVAIAQQRHVEVLLPLGLSPHWASARPDEHCAYENGFAAEPRDFSAWRNYVHVVASRYRGKIAAYEIWNEPNSPEFFSGTPAQMVQLSAIAYDEIKKADPNALVVSPSATEDGGLPWFARYLSLGGARSADVIGYHLYVFPRAPEAMLPLAQKVRELLEANHAGDKPLWDTEQGWHKTELSDDSESAYVARALVLNWAAGAERFYWYAWDNSTWVSLKLTEADHRTLRPGAKAYDVARRWLLGASLKTCSSTSEIWNCTLVRGSTSSHILWASDGQKQFTIPSQWQASSVSFLDGTTKSLPPGVVTVTPSPVLIAP